eukprot:COSAG01_NODE_12870_length_1672_cov_2.572155_2_plen_84_part_00
MPCLWYASTGLCLLEMVDCHLPWHGVATVPEVPLRVTSSSRPRQQLRKATAQMRKLIEDCWNQDPSSRPSFSEIVGQLVGGQE